MPASLLQSALEHVQLLCSHVGNNSRVKLLFCLIFLANLHIQAIFCLLPLFAIPFCQGAVLFFASGLRTNLSFYNYFMFYTCLHILRPLVSVLQLYISLQNSEVSYTRTPKFLHPDLPQKKHNWSVEIPRPGSWPRGCREDKWRLSAQTVCVKTLWAESPSFVPHEWSYGCSHFKIIRPWMHSITRQCLRYSCSSAVIAAY